MKRAEKTTEGLAAVIKLTNLSLAQSSTPSESEKDKFHRSKQAGSTDQMALD